MRVRVNSKYEYRPNGWDSLMPCQSANGGKGNGLTPGQTVEVINLHGAPPANTMGQCYVGDAVTGKFICMVSTGSLVKLTKPGYVPVKAVR